MSIKRSPTLWPTSAARVVNFSPTLLVSAGLTFIAWAMLFIPTFIQHPAMDTVKMSSAD
jgi:hypothetical protein